MGTKLWDIWAYFRGQRKCTQQNALTKTSFTHNIVSIQQKEQQISDYITWRVPTSKNPLNYRVATSGYCEKGYSLSMIYMESRYRNRCLRKKNSKLFTVDLKILETIQRLFG